MPRTMLSRLLPQRLLNRKRGARWAQPLLEELESRTLLASFLVNSPGDGKDKDLSDGKCDTGNKVSGVDECTLRAAIETANTTSEIDTINFQIPGSGSHVIRPFLGSLPDI